MNHVQCDKCKKWFAIDPFYFGIIKKDDLTVQYLSCPFCDERFHVFTEDAEMHKLVEKRNAVQIQIKIAREKKFRKQAIKKCEHELETIIRKQKKRMPRLRAAGEKILQDWKAGNQ